MLIPSTAEAIEPPVDVLQRRAFDGVEPPGALRADSCEAVLPQHPQVLGDPGLGQAELSLDDGRDLPGRQLPVGEQLEDPPAYRVPEDVEGVHGTSIQ